ncbi:hypothetical protein FRC02_009515 [Tulasnella sp. 418]|nr:hypothetical protein FRC02_009515 [Tulasnella sp. 418]
MLYNPRIRCPLFPQRHWQIMINCILITIILSILTCNQLVLGFPLEQPRAPTTTPDSYNIFVSRHGEGSADHPISQKYWVLRCVVIKAMEEHEKQEETWLNLHKQEINSGLREINGSNGIKIKIARAKQNVELAEAVEQQVKREFHRFIINRRISRGEISHVVDARRCSKLDANGQITDIVRQKTSRSRQLLYS